MKTAELLANQVYICKEMLWDLPPVKVTIDRVEGNHLVPKPGTSKKDRKCVLFFVGKKKGLVMNAKNTKFLIRTLGGNNTDTWKGRDLVLYIDKSVRMGKDRCGGIRLQVGELYSGDSAPPGVKAMQLTEDFPEVPQPVDDDPPPAADEWGDAAAPPPATKPTATKENPAP